MSQTSVQFSNNGKPVSGPVGSGNTDSKSQKSILVNKGQGNLVNNGNYHTSCSLFTPI